MYEDWQAWLRKFGKFSRAPSFSNWRVLKPIQLGGPCGPFTSTHKDGRVPHHPCPPQARMGRTGGEGRQESVPRKGAGTLSNSGC